MTDRSLVGFVTIVEEGSFSAAADALFITQSALSQQIKTLETELGFELFVHNTKKVQLTPAGQAFYPKIREAMLNFREATTFGRAVAQTHRRKQEIIHIGCPPHSIFHFWMDIFRFTMEIESGYKPLVLRFKDMYSIHRSIQVGVLDLSLELESRAAAAAGLQFMPIAELREWCLTLPVSKFDAKNSELTLQDIAAHTIVFNYEPGYTLVEDEIRETLAANYPETVILNPTSYLSMNYDDTNIVLFPGNEYYPFNHVKKDMHPIVPFRWEHPLRLGFVFLPDCEARVREYMDQVRLCVEKNNLQALWND